MRSAEDTNDRFREPGSDRTDNLAPNPVRNSPVTPTEEQRGDFDRRDHERLELEQSSDRDLALTRTFARARHRGLRVSVPDATGQPLPQPWPFEAPEHPPERWFDEPLPAYIDWKTFVYLNGPGRGFAHWLAKVVRPCADVVPVLAPGAGKNDWRSSGCAPLMAERARPALPPDRARRRQELEERIRRYRAHRNGKPLREMNVAFAHDIHNLDRSLDAADALGLGDYFMRVGKTVLVDVQHGSRGGRRYAEKGREHLSRLGAWPWCLTRDGELPPNWHLQQEYAEALAQWHYPQWLAAFLARRDLDTALSGSLGAVARHPSMSRASSESQAIKAAKATYREFYERLP